MTWSALVAQTVKNLPALQETWVRSLAWDEPLEEEMATHSRTLAQRIPWTEESGGLGLPPRSGYHGILGGVPCPVQDVLTSYLSYT